MRVLEFKHIGPFDGCHWRWEYLAVDKEGVYPIIFTDCHLAPDKVVSLWADTVGTHVYYARLFKDFTLFEWDEVLWREIPHPYVPTFCKFAIEHGLKFLWWCDLCGEPQTESSETASGWREAGGPFLESDGWLCQECIG